MSVVPAPLAVVVAELVLVVSLAPRDVRIARVVPAECQSELLAVAVAQWLRLVALLVALPFLTALLLVLQQIVEDVLVADLTRRPL